MADLAAILHSSALIEKIRWKSKFQWIFAYGVEWKSYIIEMSTINDFHFTPSVNIYWNFNFRLFFLTVQASYILVQHCLLWGPGRREAGQVWPPEGQRYRWTDRQAGTSCSQPAAGRNAAALSGSYTWTSYSWIGNCFYHQYTNEQTEPTEPMAGIPRTSHGATTTHGKT